MKRNKIKTILILITIALIGIFPANAQTFFSGSVALGNSCTPGAGVTGTNGTFIGCGAGASNSGAQNTFLGHEAGKSNRLLTENVAVGYRALYTQFYNASAFSTYNTALGNYALFTNDPTSSSTGIKNTAVGHNALYGNTIGTSNSALGFEAMKSNTSAGENVAIGYQALWTQSYTPGSAWSSANTAIGYQALFSNAPTSTGTGGANTASGWKAGFTNSTGSGNSFFGVNAGFASNGNNNVAVGSHSLYNNSTGEKNVCVGNLSMYNKTTGSYNVAVGDNAGTGTTGSTTYSYNSFLGYQSGFSCTSGGNNTFAGSSAGITNTTGSYNTCTGYGANVNAGGLNNATALGNGAIATSSNYIQFGDANVTVVHGSVAYTWSDARVKKEITENVIGLEFINKLRPVTYKLDTRKITEMRTKNLPDSIRARYFDGVDYDGSSSIVRTGFIAQEVQQAAKDCHYTSDIVRIPSDTSTDTYSLAYSQMVVPMVKAIQELSKTVDSLKALASGQRTMNNGSNGEKNVQDIKLALPDGATLGEPQPNPNSGSTQIPYYLPQNTTGAKIIFTDMLGKVMEERVLQAGYGLLNIDTQDLPGGVYSYSLIVNDKVVDNKKMMRNK